MNYIKEFTLDFNAQLPIKSIMAKQNDINSRVLIITPAADGQKIDINNITAVFFAEKPDGKTICNNCIKDKNGNIVIVLTSQTLALSGVVKCEIKLYQGDTVLSSCPFCIEVVESIEENAVESSNEYTILSELIERCNTLLKSAYLDIEKNYSSAYETVNLNPEIKTYKEETAQ